MFYLGIGVNQIFLKCIFFFLTHFRNRRVLQTFSKIAPNNCVKDKIILFLLYFYSLQEIFQCCCSHKLLNILTLKTCGNSMNRGVESFTISTINLSIHDSNKRFSTNYMKALGLTQAYMLLKLSKNYYIVFICSLGSIMGNILQLKINEK